MATAKVNEVFAHLRSLAFEPLTDDLEKEIVAQGEIMSTNMVTFYMKEIGLDVELLNALDFMRLAANGEPDLGYIREHLLPLLDFENKEIELPVISRNFEEFRSVPELPTDANPTFNPAFCKM